MSSVENASTTGLGRIVFGLLVNLEHAASILMPLRLDNPFRFMPPPRPPRGSRGGANLLSVGLSGWFVVARFPVGLFGIA